MQLVPQPLDGAAAVKDAALQGVGSLSIDLPRNRRHQSRAAADRLCPHIHQGKAARTVCILGIAHREAGLPKQRRLLIARRAADTDTR